MISEHTEYHQVADRVRREHGPRAHAHALQSLAQATEDCNQERVAFWRYVALMLALRSPLRIDGASRELVFEYATQMSNFADSSQRLVIHI
jgi:hypothetical protein